MQRMQLVVWEAKEDGSARDIDCPVPTAAECTAVCESPLDMVVARWCRRVSLHTGRDLVGQKWYRLCRRLTGWRCILQRAHLCLRLRSSFSLRARPCFSFTGSAPPWREMKISWLNGVRRPGIITLARPIIRNNEPDPPFGQEVHIQCVGSFLIPLDRNDSLVPVLLRSITLRVRIRTGGGPFHLGSLAGVPILGVCDATDETTTAAVGERVARPSAIHVKLVDVVGRVVVRSDAGHHLVIRLGGLRCASSQYAKRS